MHQQPTNTAKIEQKYRERFSEMTMPQKGRNDTYEHGASPLYNKDLYMPGFSNY